MVKNYCKKGKFQSPIDIKSKKAKKCAMQCELMIYYKNSSCKMKRIGNQLTLDYDSGSYVIYNSQVYELE